MPARTIDLDELNTRFEKMASVIGRSAGIGVTDVRAAAYARVLEYGSIAGHPPWPHTGKGTVAAVNPETGAQVVVSAQAAQGFIRLHAPEFLNQIRESIASPVDWLDAQEIDLHIASAVCSSAVHAVEEMRAAVPRESGRLAQSLAIVNG